MYFLILFASYYLTAVYERPRTRQICFMKERNNLVTLFAFDCILSMFSMKTSCSKPVSYLRFQRFFNKESDIFFLSRLKMYCYQEKIV